MSHPVRSDLGGWNDRLKTLEESQKQLELVVVCYVPSNLFYSQEYFWKQSDKSIIVER